jgi:hypothetical protein
MEISEVSIRGSLASINILMLNLGIAFVSCFNIYNFLSWTNISVICACVPVLAIICIFFIPESPYHLLKQEREEEASKALQESTGETSMCPYHALGRH